MFVKCAVSVLVFVSVCTIVSGGCERDRNVLYKKPLYLDYGDGFFFIQGLTNGETVVVYKHPDDARIFGQYTFKDEKCRYETVYYYVLRGKYEFTNPYIMDEANFNITNRITFVKNGAGYEIEYNINPKGFGYFQNLGTQAERQIFPEPIIKKTPALSPVREIFLSFEKIGKQNLKVSYLKNGENYIQFVSKRNQFSSIEGQYTFRTSDRKYHSITYEIPLDDFDYSGMSVREYEISVEENFFKTGTLNLALNGTKMDVRYFVNSEGFHVTGLKRPVAPVNPIRPQLNNFNGPVNPIRPQLNNVNGPVNPIRPQLNNVNGPVNPIRPQLNNVNAPLNPIRSQVNNFNALPANAGRPVNNRPVRNQPQPRNSIRSFNGRVLNPTFSRPDLLTGDRSIQAGK